MEFTFLLALYDKRCRYVFQTLVCYRSLLLIAFSIVNYELTSNIYLFKINNRKARKKCEICSKLTINTPERRRRRASLWCFYCEFLTYFKAFSNVSVVEFE